MSSTESGVPARVAAAAMLGRVLRGGAFSNVLAPQTEGASAPHARELLFGAIRDLPRIEHAIAANVNRDPGAVDAGVMDILRIGTYELLAGREPHAAVNTAVESAKELGHGRAAGFVNAVLRKVASGHGVSLPAGLDGRALRAGHHRWVVARLESAWGRKEADAFFDASRRPPHRSARLRNALREDASPISVPGTVELEPGPVPPNAVIQDASSVAVGWAVRPEPGDALLDMAAAPGGKTLHLWDQVQGDATLVAMDRHERRLRRAQERLTELDAHPEWLVGDGRHPPLKKHSFDRVLLDAPCSGLGTLRRRPELAFRVTETEVTRLAALQRTMLDRALDLAKPGGAVIYSVCTVLPEETIEVVAGRGARLPEGLPGRRWEDGWLLGPHLTGSDGMFVSVIPVD